MSRIAEMTTSAVTNRGKRVVKIKRGGKGKERMDTSSLMEQILSSDNLNRAYLQVVRNKDAEGVDGMEVHRTQGTSCKERRNHQKEQLRDKNINLSQYEEWRYQSLMAVSGNLGIPTVTDRFVQQAIAQVLTPIYEEQFHDQSYGFRPNRCAQQAILTALRYDE